MKLINKGKVKCTKSLPPEFSGLYLKNIDYYISVGEDDGDIYIDYDDMHACKFTKEETIKYFKGDYVTILERADKLKKLENNG